MLSQTKLKELKRACEYSDKIPYLLIDNNEAAEPMAVENPAHEEILNEVNTLFKFLHPEFIPTMKLIIERTLAIEQGEPSMLATQICEVIQEHPASHKMILNLALIKTNIEEDLEYVLKLVARDKYGRRTRKKPTRTTQCNNYGLTTPRRRRSGWSSLSDR